MANVAVTNTTGLYIGSGASPVLNNAQQLLSLLSNNGGVTFSLDPAYANTKVEAFGPNINANIAAYLPSYTGLLGGTLVTAAQPNITSVGTLSSVTSAGNITSGGNVSGVYFLGNGSQLTGLPATYSNANVASYLPTYTGNLVSMTGNIITTANVTGAYILGNGSQLSGLPATYSNANVAAYLPTYTGNLVSLTGNVTTTANVRGAYILGDGSQLINLPAGNYSNVNVAAYLASNSAVTILTTANVTSAANVAGNYILGNAAYMTGIPTGNYSNVNVAAYLPVYTGNMVSMTGNVITTANATANYFIGNGAALRSLTGANVTGTVANATYATSAGSASTAGLATYVTGNAQANITSVGTLSSLTVTGNVTSSANVSGVYFLGNGSQLTGVQGNYSNANVASYLPTYTGNLASVTGPVGGTLSTAAQPNITSVGTLTSLTVTGNITSASGNVAGNYFIGNGSALTGMYGNTQVANYLASNSAVTILTTANVSAANFIATGTTGNITGANYITANYFLGNGSFLTGVGNFSNANVASYLPTYTGNLVSLTGNVITTANVQAAYFIGNGSALTGVTGNFSNTNVAAYLPVYGGNILASSINTTSGISSGGGLMANAAFTNTYSDGIVADYVTGSGRVSVGANDGINFYTGGVGTTLLGNLSATGLALQSNITTNPGAASAFGNLNQLSGNTYIGSDATLFNATTTATGTAQLAGQAPIRIGGQYTVTGNASVQMGTMILANLQLGRPNTNNSARVRHNYIGAGFDVNGYTSTIGLSPFSDGGSASNLITGITRAPQNTISMYGWNSQGPSGNAQTISSMVGQSSLVSLGQTSANLTCTYAVAVNGVIAVSANTNQITNATAFRADFAQTMSNAAVIGNRLAFECIDPTANIKIAGNVVSTAGAVVAANVTLKGYTETIDSTTLTGGTFTPNVSNATIYTGTITSNLTFNGFSNPVAGQSATVIITQGSGGNFTLSSTMKFAGNSRTLSTAAGAIDMISVFYDGTNYYASLTTGYA